jgi:hypothetical protein
MKRIILTSFLSCLASVRLFAVEGEVTLSEEEIRKNGPLPDDKIAETLKKGERNPFAERQSAVATKEDDGESENARLMRVLNELVISGVIRDNDGRYKVLIGRKLLAEGDRMPQLLEGQTSLLRVSKVSEKSVEIAWVEDQAAATPRKVTRQVRVNQQLIQQVLPALGGENAQDGKSKSTISVWVTPRGETYREEGATTPDATEQETDSGNLPPSIDLNHRPAPPSVQRATRINSR